MDRDSRVAKAREGGWGWVEVGKGGEVGTSVVVSTIKKILAYLENRSHTFLNIKTPMF